MRIRHGASCDCQVRNLPGKAFDDFITKCIGELGGYPDIIKSELNAVNRQIKELDSQLKNCLAVAKQKGAGQFTNTLLKEADELSLSRHAAEKERERLKTHIDLVQLLQEIRVSRIEPEKFEKDLPPGAHGKGMRTFLV